MNTNAMRSLIVLSLLLGPMAARANLSCPAPLAQLEAVTETAESLAEAAVACPTDEHGEELDFARALTQVCELSDYEHFVGRSRAAAEHHLGRVSEEERGYPALLSDKDRVAIFAYTGNCYRAINRRLWEAESLLEVPAAQRMIAARLYLALSRLPAHRGQVRRGTTVPAEVLAQYQPGAELTFRGLTSTSIDRPWDGNITMSIDSRTGRYVRLFSPSFYENEVLFPPYTRVRVLERVNPEFPWSEEGVQVSFEDLGPDLRQMLGISDEARQQEIARQLSRLTREILGCAATGARPDPSLLPPAEDEVPPPRSQQTLLGLPFRIAPCAREWIQAGAYEAARNLLREFGAPRCNAFREVYPVVMEALQAQLTREYYEHAGPLGELRNITRVREGLLARDLSSLLGAELRRDGTTPANVLTRLRAALDREFNSMAAGREIRADLLAELRAQWPRRSQLQRSLERTLTARMRELDDSIRGRFRACVAGEASGLRQCLESGLEQDVRAQVETLARLEGYTSAEATDSLFGALIEQRTRGRYQTLIGTMAAVGSAQ